MSNQELEYTIYGRLVSIKRENDGKRIIITLERNSGISEYIANKLFDVFGNSNVCIEFTPLIQYLKFQKILDEDDDKKQSKLQ